MTEVKIKKLYDDSQIPTYGTIASAGMDLYAHLPEGFVVINPHETKKIGTGIAVEPPTGTFGAIFPRSGLSAKEGLRPANCVGVCDWDYRGEYIVAMHNDTDKPRTINPGDRIAQLVFLPYVQANVVEVDELENTERADGGFGSTGK